MSHSAALTEAGTLAFGSLGLGFSVPRSGFRGYRVIGFRDYKV